MIVNLNLHNVNVIYGLDEKKCCKCKQSKDISEFYVTFREARNCYETYSRCKQCSSLIAVAWQKRNPERMREINRASQFKRRKKILAYNKRYYSEHADQRRAKQIAYWRSLKDEVYFAYGGYKCACCGEETKAFLSIDHIDGGGNKHRREIGRGPNLMHWLKARHFPSGFQVLCMNCQFGKKHNDGICPHKQR